MNGINPTEFYRVRLIDYALPSFWDGESYYYDTAHNIRLLFEHSLTDKGRAKAEGYLAAMDEYLSGRGPGRVRLQYEEPAPLLSRVKFLGKRSWECGPQTYLFKNIWGCEYEVRMDSVQVDAVYLEDLELPEEPLIRCVKLQIKGPRYLAYPDDDPRSFRRFWGYPHMIEKRGEETLGNSLYYPDRFFRTAADVRADMEAPCPADFNRFFLEIFGDG